MSGSAILSNSIDPKSNGNSSGFSELNNSYNGNPSPQVPKLPPKKLTLSGFDDVTCSRDVPSSSTIKYHRLIDSYHSKEDGEDQYFMLDNSIKSEEKLANKKSVLDMNKENANAQGKQTLRD